MKHRTVAFLSFFTIFFLTCNSPTGHRAADETDPAAGFDGADSSLSLLGEPRAQLDPRLTCDSETSCFHTGCLGQLCATEEIVTSCEFRCEFACYAQAECDCRGIRCGFRMTAALEKCLRECGVRPNPFPPAS